ATVHRLDDYVGHLLRRAHLISSGVTAKYIRDVGLTPPQMAALLKLREVERVSQNELGRLVAMERANIHGIVSRLLTRGLVEATTDATDARKTVLRLSGKGRKLVETVEPLHWQAMVETMSVLNGRERGQLLRLLKKFCGITAPG
ncbi:MAG TPA: MarR family transcriptional regulator, partial [Acidobacteria bacterium]|nr:MarR family transcriptional regulator [Acidobacteriota bacterium]